MSNTEQVESVAITGDKLPPLSDQTSWTDEEYEDAQESGPALLAHFRKAGNRANQATLIDEFVAAKTSRLADIRQAAGFTQARLATILGVSQPEVSKLERREVNMLDTLFRYVGATGCRLRLMVELEDGSIVEYEPQINDASASV